MSSVNTSTDGPPWFRVYNDLFSDPRFRRKPLYVRWAWLAVLRIANACEKRGHLIIDGDNMTAADLSDVAAISLKEASEALAYFTSKKLIVSPRGSMRVEAWDRRQFATDNSTARVRKHRSGGEKRKRRCNVSRNANVTPPEYRVQSTDIKDSKLVGSSDVSGGESPSPKPLAGFPDCFSRVCKMDGIERSLEGHIMATVEATLGSHRAMMPATRGSLGEAIRAQCPPDCPQSLKASQSCASAVMDCIERKATSAAEGKTDNPLKLICYALKHDPR